VAVDVILQLEFCPNVRIAEIAKVKGCATQDRMMHDCGDCVLSTVVVVVVVSVVVDPTAVAVAVAVTVAVVLLLGFGN
jgi:hypothetical protein